MRFHVIGAALIAFACATPAYANLNVFACEPEYGALVHEIGGDKVTLYTATTGMQDPHQIQARPSLIAKARAADITVCAGAELEIGWLPMLEQQAANPKIATGQPGHFEAARFVRLLEAPAVYDRSMGDIHAAGNPHVQTSPPMMLTISKALADRFAQLDGANAAYYQSRYTDFSNRFRAAIAKWQAEAAPLRNVPVAVQHHSWIYMLNWLGMREVVALEPKPGVPASAGYLAEVLQKLQAQPVKMVIRAGYEDDRPSLFVAEKAGIPAVKLPYTVGGTDAAKDLFSLYEDTIQRLLAGLAGKSSN